jgi:hypothetical protein
MREVNWLTANRIEGTGSIVDCSNDRDWYEFTSIESWMKSGLGTGLVAGFNVPRSGISYLKSPTAGGDPASEANKRNRTPGTK